MKIVAIGDIHGRNVWQKIINKEAVADKVVFVGDYFDSYDPISGTNQLENFLNILDLKRSNIHKFSLLLGNHDFHYLKNADEKYSGYQNKYANIFGDELEKAIEEQLVQICSFQQNIFFSHAGITKTWCYNNLPNVDFQDPYGLEKVINAQLHNNPRAFTFKMGSNLSPYGDDITQSPIWVRPESLLSDIVLGYTQVVGHTQQKTIKYLENVYFIDALGTAGQYLVLEGGKRIVKKI